MDALGWRKGGGEGGKRENEHIEPFGEREITTHTVDAAAAATEMELTVKIAREGDRSETEMKTRAECGPWWALPGR